MKSDFIVALTQLASERNLPREIVVSAIEDALLSAYKGDSVAANQDISEQFYKMTQLSLEVQEHFEEYNPKLVENMRNLRKLFVLELKPLIPLPVETIQDIMDFLCPKICSKAKSAICACFDFFGICHQPENKQQLFALIFPAGGRSFRAYIALSVISYLSLFIEVLKFNLKNRCKILKFAR